VAPNMHPMAPGPMPGIPIFEWHTREVSCGNKFTDAEAEEAARKRRKERKQKELEDRRQREAQHRIAGLERERDAALGELPAVDRPNPVKEETAARGCSIGCGLWAALLGVALIVLAVNGQFDSEADPTILGVENPLLFLPGLWAIGWIVASVRLASAKQRYRTAEAAADQRAAEHARVEADFESRIAAAKAAARQ
jgi:hypothetical protein